MKPGRTLAPTAAPVSMADVLRSAAGAFISARTRRSLEHELATYLSAADAILVSSGKAALTAALEVLHARRGARRVAIPAYTCFTVPAAIVRAGLEPVLVDVDPDTLDFTDASLARILDTPDLLAIVPTHLFGVAADVDRVRAAAPRDLVIIEDAAQALGLTARNSRRLGSMGDVAILSLGRGKHLTCGGGGILTARSPELAAAFRERCNRLPAAGWVRSTRVWIELAVMSAFIHPGLYWFPAGLPFLGLGETEYDTSFPMAQLPATAIAALRGWRTRLDASNGARRDVVEAWQRELGIRLAAEPTALLRLPVILPSAEQRNRLVRIARERGLGVSPMYPSAIHQIPELRDRFAGQRFPGAEALAARLATLPTHLFVTASDRAALRAVWPEAVQPASAAPSAVEASC
jgi:perosamine synthetase